MGTELICFLQFLFVSFSFLLLCCLFAFTCVWRSLEHRFVLPDLQNLHSPHSGIYKGMTWSPVLLSCCYYFYLHSDKWHSWEVMHTLTRFDSGNSFSNTFDNSCSLMAQDAWKSAFWVLEAPPPFITNCSTHQRGGAYLCR